jgi:hypothetical protein
MPVKRTTAAPPPPAEAQARALLDSFPDAVSYPATQVTAMRDTALAASFYDLSGGQHLSREDSLLYRRGRAEAQWWCESGAQELLAEKLPGVRFFRGWQHIFGYEYGNWRDMAYNGGVLYRLDALNRLLLEAGFSFDSTEMTTIAKIAVLFATFGKTFDASGQFRDAPMPTDSTPGAGFPSITFLSVSRDTWRPKGSSIWDGTWVDCLFDGTRGRAFVSFWGADERGRRQPERVYGAGLNLMPWPAHLP